MMRWRSHSHKTRFVARESIIICCYYVLPLKKSPILSNGISVYLRQNMGTDIEDSADTMCFTFSPLSSRSPSHFTNNSSQKDSRFDRNTGFSAIYSKWPKFVRILVVSRFHRNLPQSFGSCIYPGTLNATFFSFIRLLI